MQTEIERKRDRDAPKRLREEREREYAALRPSDPTAPFRCFMNLDVECARFEATAMGIQRIKRLVRDKLVFEYKNWPAFLGCTMKLATKTDILEHYAEKTRCREVYIVLIEADKTDIPTEEDEVAFVIHERRDKNK